MEEHIRFKNYTQMASSSVCLLKNASFSLRKGKMTALIGLSGEGKSTLMNAIVGLDKSNKKAYGEILVEENGEMVPRDPVKWFQRVGYVRQGFINYKNMPVMDILKSVCKCYGQSEEKIEVFLGKLRMQKTKNTKYKNLSGGEQRRIMTIIGLLNNAELNIWDEPLTGLDSEIAHTSLTMMRASGKTNLVSVHQVSDDLMKLFDDLIVVHNTTIIYSGPIENTHSYFGQHNVSFPTDIFYINYIIRLSAGNTNTTEDIQNVENFNKLADSILNKETEKTQPAIKPRMFVPFSMPNITRIKEVYKRSLFFNKKVRGEHFIIDTLFHFLLIVGTSIVVYFLKPELKNIFGYISKLFSDGLDKIEKNTRQAEETLGTTKYVLKFAEWILNLNMVFIQYLFVTILYTSIIVYAWYYLSTLVSKEYYTLCCQCIEEKQFTNVDMICAILFDLFIRKFVFCFVTAFIIGNAVHSIGHPMLIRGTEVCAGFGYLTVFNCAFLFSLLVFLYSVIVNFLPLPSKIVYGLISLVCTGCILLPYSMYSFSYGFQVLNGGSADMLIGYKNLDSIFLYPNVDYDPNLVPGPENEEDTTLESKVARYKEIYNKNLEYEANSRKTSLFNQIRSFLSNRCIYAAMRYSPPAIVVEYYTKVGAYLEYIPLKVTGVFIKIVAMLIVRILNKSRNPIDQEKTFRLDTILAEVSNTRYKIGPSNGSGGFQPSYTVLTEIFDKNAPLPSCGIARVAWGLLRFFLFPSIFLFILMVYSYKSLQPSLK